MLRFRKVLAPARLAVMALTALLALSPLAAIAAPGGPFGTSSSLSEAPTGTPLLLGEYAFVDMANGDSVSYSVVIPESGSYLITAVDDDAAADFDLVVTNEAGDELFNDVFATTDLDLETGTITLNFSAAADNQLSFVVVGQIGGMSEDENQPGKLVPGSVYLNDEVSDTLYATLSVPPTDYPRQVLIAIQGGDGDTFYAYAQGQNEYGSTSTDTDDILRFWTHGGDIELQVQAYERRSELSLIVFVTGEPAPLTFDEPLEGTLPAKATEVVYEVQLDANYTDLELSVDSDESLGVTLLDNYYDYDIYFSSYGEDSVDIDALYPGVYYVLVQASEAPTEDVSFTLNITGDAGRPTAALEDGSPVVDEFEDGESSINYSFDVATPGSIVTVSLTGDDEDVDFDLTAGLRPGGTNWSSYSSGSDETLTFLAPIAGTYYASVVSNDNTGAYTIKYEEGDPAPTLETNITRYDQIDGRTQKLYLLPVNQGGQLLSVILVGPENADLDLSVSGYNSQGDNILSLSGYSSGSAEAVSYLLPEAGLYQVSVSSSYSDEGGYYFIHAQVIDPNYFAGQWASDATASSQYGEEDYSALQATGAKNTAVAGDYGTAWASSDADGGEETLELTYDVPVHPSAVAVYESYNPGAITTIEVYDADNEEWVVIYEGDAAPIEDASRLFVPDITPVDFVTNQVRLTLDTSAVEGWNEIDAVELFGRP
jgi:hypothetical protein